MLVVHPLAAEAQKLAGLAAELGYEADVATNGRHGFELAVHSPDYEFVLIHSRIERPSVDELLAQLRRDRRTSLLPVGLDRAAGRRGANQRLCPQRAADRSVLAAAKP